MNNENEFDTAIVHPETTAIAGTGPVSTDPDENMVFVLRHLAQHPGIDNNVALEAGRRADRIGADKPNLSRFERTQVTIPVPTLKTEKKKQAARAA